MQKLKRLSIVPFAILLIAASIQVYAKNIDCRSCHAPNKASGISDLSKYYSQPTDHHPTIKEFHFKHPIGMQYPSGSKIYQKLKLPNAKSVEVVFFDKNGNNQPDTDEVQLFAAINNATGKVISKKGVFTIECSTCHAEHGIVSDPIKKPANLHLRISHEKGELCLTCHKF